MKSSKIYIQNIYFLNLDRIILLFLPHGKQQILFCRPGQVLYLEIEFRSIESKRQFVRGSSATFSCRRYETKDLLLPHARAFSRRRYGHDGSRWVVALRGIPFGVPSLVGSAGQVLPLGWGRCLEEFSWEGSAARRLLVYWRNIPEKFMGP
ncbi:hypothetical protein EVAR_47332_1 [Eumeta japonica]|uniref:Uncharacterized protein n=1 Tax=Eumeta variegata TaxID=151549 RepID=A0A4C1WUA3_EUMVA|nr:hypothetical protein EVAR_47332_1 [Eumeta japonica]